MDGKFECNAVDISREDNQIYLYYHARIQMDGKFEFPIHIPRDEKICRGC